jgi:hypothetical protein
MELLLNLAWLMLAVPALLVWRRQSASTRSSEKQCGTRSFIVLGCILALLFPVVSATDDLHPIRAESEESSPSKRAVKQSPGVKSPAWSCDGGRPLRLVQVAAFRPENDTWEPVSEHLPLLPEHAQAGTINDRAPPQT